MQQLPATIERAIAGAPTFGAWLKRLRKASDLTQDELAAQIGYAGAAIRKIEAGERRPSREIAERIAQLLIANLEHLIDAAAGPIAEIIRQAPGVKVLITSRERLRMQGEWGIEVGGLRYPDEPPTCEDRRSKTEDRGAQSYDPRSSILDPRSSAVDAEAYEAIALFLRQAHQAQPDFHPSASDLREIARICRLVEGMPLGIEMAAAWTHMLSCAEIAQEIERNIDFLVASARDTPARHRSLRAVFDHSRMVAQFAIRGLGIVAYRPGNYAEARGLFDESLAIARALDHLSLDL